MPTSVHAIDPERLGDHADRLYRAARAMCRTREDAEDLVQETYARVLARPRLLHGDADIGYLYGAMRNTFLHRLRTDSRRPRYWAAGDDIDAIADRRATDDAAVHEAHQVLAAIADLPQELRDAVVAVDLVGLSYQEAARSLRTAPSTIGSRVFRGRELVARRLSGYPPATSSASADRRASAARSTGGWSSRSALRPKQTVPS